MSIVVKTPKNELVVYAKGADEAILGLLKGAKGAKECETN